MMVAILFLVVAGGCGGLGYWFGRAEVKAVQKLNGELLKQYVELSGELDSTRNLLAEDTDPGIDHPTIPSLRLE
jgi:hypothetical protein